MPFNFFDKERLTKQIEAVADLRYREHFCISNFTAYEDDGEVGVTCPNTENPIAFQLGDRWKGKDRYLWLCFTAKLPSHFMGEKVVGLFDFGETGGGNNSKFESLLFVNGKPFQAVDTNHKEVFFDTTQTGDTLLVQVRLWTGLNGGGKTTEQEHQIKAAGFAILDIPTDKFYYLALNVMKTLSVLDDSNPSKSQLLNELVRAFNKIDYSEPGSQEFYRSISEANSYLQNKIAGQNKLPVSVSLIGHTHIDVAWLWRLKHTREKAARSFTTVTKLMEDYPDYKFLQTQAQLYDYIKTDYPEIYDQIKKRIAEGRWEPSGSMWVECDCNVTSGESIVRQILYGKGFFEKEFGYTNDFLWLPDVFGYSWALPQILKLSEINTFVTTKISWNDTNRMPYDTFKWRGIDGSEVTAHFVTTPEEFNSLYYTYNGLINPYTIKGVWDSYSNKDLNTDLLISYGYGDGGGGVNRDMLESIDCINKIPGLPTVKTEFVKDYLTRLNQTIDTNERGGYIPTWDGELYLEFHRGTYTSQAYNKKTNRQMEFLIRDAEMLSVFAMITEKSDYPSELIYDAWKIILRNQFHDIIPGSSIREVYEDCHIEYAEVQQLLEQVIAKASAQLTAPAKQSYTLVNTLNWSRTSVVTLPNGEQQLVENIPALSTKTIKAMGSSVPKKLTLTDNSVQTTYYTIAWNAKGQLTSIFDRRANREVIAQDKKANVLHVYEDKPRAFDAWELESTYAYKCETIEKLISVEATETDYATCISFVWEFRKSLVKQTLYLYEHTARIDFKTNINWQEQEKLLKVDFPVNIRATDARYDIQFGNVTRPTTRNHSWDMAKFEVVAHKWMDLSETGYGVALLNDCKYGHSVKDNVITLTLLKSSIYPDYAQDQGEHDFTYALYPHTEQWYEAGIIEESFEINVQPLVLAGESRLQTPLFQIDNPCVTIDTIKKAQDTDAIIIRLHEHSGSRGNVYIKTNFAYEDWCECNLMEKNINSFTSESIAFNIKPYEIKTIKINLSK